MVNLAESWVGLRVVSVLHVWGSTFTEKIQGGEKYQQAFYVFEELAQAPSTSSVRSLVSQAVCELHLGRTEEAQAALEQALEKDANNADAIANLLVLNVISGNQSDEFAQSVPLSDSNLETRIILTCTARKLRGIKPNHQFLADLEEKSALFDKAATKYSPKVSA